MKQRKQIGKTANKRTSLDQGNKAGEKKQTSLPDDSTTADELVFMLQEEKMAGDIYTAFFEQTGMKIFANIAASEESHANALTRQAEKLGVNVDAFVFQPSGSFVDPEIQSLYDDLLAQGSVSATAALEVGILIETKDMVDLAAAAEAVEGTTLAGVYESLLAGSANHLEAFEGVLGL